MEKPKLREKLRKQRDAVDPILRQSWDQQIHNKFWSLAEYAQAEWIMLYLAFGSEVDTWPILTKAWEQGKRVAVPKVCKYPQEIIAVEIMNKKELELSFWGIYEPIKDEAVSPKVIDIIIVPGLAFDQQGYRIGYGGGYYDRFLPQVSGYKIGFCYPPFLIDIPVFPWDQPVDLIITP